MRKVLSQRKKATILFATETGRSEGFARNLAKLMSHSFDVKVCYNRSSSLLRTCSTRSFTQKLFSQGRLGKTGVFHSFARYETCAVLWFSGNLINVSTHLFQSNKGFPFCCLSGFVHGWIRACAAHSGVLVVCTYQYLWQRWIPGEWGEFFKLFKETESEHWTKLFEKPQVTAPES